MHGHEWSACAMPLGNFLFVTTTPLILLVARIFHSDGFMILIATICHSDGFVMNLQYGPMRVIMLTWTAVRDFRDRLNVQSILATSQC